MNNKQFIEIVDNSITKFKGDAHVLSSAIGMLAMCRRFGWKPIYLIYSKATVKKYEKVLGIEIRDHFREAEELASRSMAYKLVENVGNFWKAVKGEIPNIRTPEIK